MDRLPTRVTCSRRSACIERAGEAFCPNSGSALRALEYSPWAPPSREAIALSQSSSRAIVNYCAQMRCSCHFRRPQTSSSSRVLTGASFWCSRRAMKRAYTRRRAGRLSTSCSGGCTATRDTFSSPKPLRRAVLPAQASRWPSSRVSAAMWAHPTVRQRKALRSRHSTADSTNTSLARGAPNWRPQLQRGANFTLESGDECRTVWRRVPKRTHRAASRSGVAAVRREPAGVHTALSREQAAVVPSVALLARWHVHYFIVRRRTLFGRGDRRPGGSFQRPHEGFTGRPDPTNEWDEEAIRYWLQYAD